MIISRKNLIVSFILWKVFTNNLQIVMLFLIFALFSEWNVIFYLLVVVFITTWKLRFKQNNNIWYICYSPFPPSLFNVLHSSPTPSIFPPFTAPPSPSPSLRTSVINLNAQWKHYYSCVWKLKKKSKNYP